MFFFYDISVSAAETDFVVSLSCQDLLARSGPRPPCSVALNPGFYPACELQSTKDTEALYALGRTFAGASDVSWEIPLNQLSILMISPHS